MLSQQNQGLRGLEQASAMARGQQASATQGLHELAASANRKAAFDAKSTFADQSANRNLAGQVIGSGLGYGLYKEKFPKTNNKKNGLGSLL